LSSTGTSRKTGEVSGRAVRDGVVAGLGELGAEQMFAHGHGAIRGDLLDVLAEPVVDVVQSSVVEVEAVSASCSAVCEQNACGFLAVDGDAGGDGVRAPADVDGYRLRDVGSVWVVDVAVTGLAGLRPGRGEDLACGPIVQRQAAVDARVVEPHVLELF
jgi:hypothetical protein